MNFVSVGEKYEESENKIFRGRIEEQEEVFEFFCVGPRFFSTSHEKCIFTFNTLKFYNSVKSPQYFITFFFILESKQH